MNHRHTDFHPLPQACFPISYGGKLFKFAHCASMPCEQNRKPIVSRRPSLARNEIIVASLDELCGARLSGKRLLALWNGLPRVDQTWLCSSHVEHGVARKKPATVDQHHAGR